MGQATFCLVQGEKPEMDVDDQVMQRTMVLAQLAKNKLNMLNPLAFKVIINVSLIST